MSETKKQSIINFCQDNSILWYPIDIDLDKKINKDKYKHLESYKANPIFPTKKITGYYPKNNDFDTLSVEQICKRQKYADKCNSIAIDTRDIHHIDIDMLDSKVYPAKNMEFIKSIIKTHPYYRSMSVDNGKKQGKHIFFKTTHEFNKKTHDTNLDDIEIMCGQWSWADKTQSVVVPVNYKSLDYNINPIIVENVKKTTPKIKLKIKKSSTKSTKSIDSAYSSDSAIDIVDVPTKHNQIQELSDIININYLDNYHDWVKIVWALKFIDENLKQYAKYLSKKSDKYTDSGFDSVWTSPEYMGITKATIYYYAKRSNPKKFSQIIRKFYLSSTDNGLASMFIHYKNENIVFKDGSAYIYNGNTWYKQDKENNQLQAIITQDLSVIVEDSIKEITEQINMEHDKEEPDKNKIKTLEDCREGRIKIKKTVQSASGAKNICKMCIHQLSIMDFDNVEFDNKPDVLPFKNQYYDLNTHTLSSYKANDYIVTKLSYDYITPTESQNKTIEKLFNQIFTNQDIRRDYTHILATTMFGRPVDKFIIANGDGSNGKSMLHELLIEVLEEGRFAYVAPVSVILNKIKQGNNPEVATMNNKRFVLYREPEKNAIINAGTLKELTGSNQINARMNYSNDTSTILKATHILEANDKPKISGSAQGNSIERRLIDIDFSSTFTFRQVDIDENPSNHFMANPYFRTPEFRKIHKFALIDYLIKFITNFKNNNKKVYDEIIVSDYTQERTMAYIANSDFLMSFCRDNLIKKEDAYIKISDLYHELKTTDDFLSLTKEEKREYNQKYLTTAIMKNRYLKRHYKEIHNMNVDGVRKRVRNVLVGYTFDEKTESDDEF
jgi:phage/plasmid-associated DNA primase